VNTNELIYYNSPIGILSIQNEGDAIAEVSFMEKEQKPGTVSFATPRSAIVQQCIRQLDDYFSGKNLAFNLKLAQPGTPFQQKVWKGLQDIPHGKTTSYLRFSKALGNVKAIRAVGTANGKNNIAVIVPCHRVIGSDGNLVGYAGGLWRKQWLLEHEAKYCHGVQMLF
jgi:methylated-DNA-[protein]-cysteine S-methyltransferase